MTETLSIGWTRARADRRIAAYRRLLLLVLSVQSLIALIVLVWPGWALGLVDLARLGTDWPRAWAGMVLMASAFQVAAWSNPVHQRFPSIVAVLGRALMALIFLSLGGGFLWFALFDGVFCVLLAIGFHRLVIAELMTRP